MLFRFGGFHGVRREEPHPQNRPEKCSGEQAGCSERLGSVSCGENFSAESCGGQAGS
jgi:hypothetical protein